ncbi:hypothetical protein RCL_jg3853.t1 [Rhizophagus clarus]|uniref:Uncharacterized protein n=1 Tax=Rhizophagus clarus TaxID=94130 RepID=A0A8H3KPA8_9GLOM|nr:hypothetical protein RCL_jg3853.t1 [Rhizophagus clarus]
MIFVCLNHSLLDLRIDDSQNIQRLILVLEYLILVQCYYQDPTISLIIKLFLRFFREKSLSPLAMIEFMIEFAFS